MWWKTSGETELYHIHPGQSSHRQTAVAVLPKAKMHIFIFDVQFKMIYIGSVMQMKDKNMVMSSYGPWYPELFVEVCLTSTTHKLHSNSAQTYLGQQFLMNLHPWL